MDGPTFTCLKEEYLDQPRLQALVQQDVEPEELKDVVSVAWHRVQFIRKFIIDRQHCLRNQIADFLEDLTEIQTLLAEVLLDVWEAPLH